MNKVEKFCLREEWCGHRIVHLTGEVYSNLVEYGNF